jgi:GH35 family endo-1,4-beta-xylanase
MIIMMITKKPYLKALNYLLILCLFLPFLATGSTAHANNTILIQSDFEDGTLQNWAARGTTEQLNATAAAARSGSYGLHITDRSMEWHGPTLDVTNEMELGNTYIFKAWVKLPQGAGNTPIYMSLQRTTPSNTYYENVTNANATSSGWVKLEATYKFLEPVDNIAVYFEVPSSATQSFYLDDFTLERAPAAPPLEIEEDIPSLKDVFANDFSFGTAFTNSELYTKGDRDLLKKHFNTVTPGNVLKWDATEPAENEFNFEGADTAVDFAVDNGQLVRGHTLVWHSQTPNWVFYDNAGNLVSKQVLYARMKNHIDTVMERYKGKIYAWDVVNEVIDPAQPDGLRRSLWYQIAGEEFIEKAFEYAHAADPDAKLFINDYNTHEPAKLQALYNLIQRLQAKNVPIDGVGHQMHVSIYYPSMSEIEASIVKFKALNLESHITELDVSVYHSDSQSYETLPNDISQNQAKVYKQLFDIFKRHTDTITNVTVWGKDDANTWLRTFPVVRNNWPLLFDEQLKAKPAYWAIVDVPAGPTAPAVPTGFTAQAGNSQIELFWNKVTNADSYVIKRALTSTGPFTTVATVNGTSYIDTTVSNGTTYYYTIAAINSVGESKASSPISATPTSEPIETGELSIQYRVGDSNALDNQINPNFKIVNHGNQPVDLANLSLRYWFTADNAPGFNFFIDYAQIGNSNVLGKVVAVTPAVEGADHYIEISFKSDAGVVAPNGDSGSIQTRLHKSDWSNFNENNDYSYKGTQTTFSDWSKVTLYRNGQLIWGVEPE